MQETEIAENEQVVEQAETVEKVEQTENFTAEKETKTVAEQKVTVKAKKRFSVFSIVILVALGISLVMGIVSICISWLSTELPALSGTDTLTSLLDANKAFDGELLVGVEAILALAIIAIIAMWAAVATFVVSKFVNVKALKYVTAALSALVIVSALITLILTFNCTNTDLCKELKDVAKAEFAPAVGAWLFVAFGVIGGALGVIGAFDSDGVRTKEFCRKFIVKLKRRPMNIGLFVLAISTIVLLCSLGSISQLGLEVVYSGEMQGLCIFVAVLFSILVLLLYMNAFPKRSKKPKWVMFALTIVFMVIIIGLDLYLYIMWGINRTNDLKGKVPPSYLTRINAFYFDAVNSVLAHAILVIVSLVLMVLSPVIGNLLNKINTRVDLGESQLKNQIEVEEDD